MIDVIITSTCRPTLAKCLASFRTMVACTEGFRFLVNIDVRDETNLPQTLNTLKLHGISDIRITRHPAPSPNGHVDAINYLYEKVEERYYFSLEDDWIFLRTIDLDGYIALMDSTPVVDHVRFSKERIKGYSWLYYLSVEDQPEFRRPNTDVVLGTVPLVKTHTLSFNPSLNRSLTVQSLLPVPQDVNPEQHLCAEYAKQYAARGAYIAGHIDEEPWVKDIGRNPVREAMRKFKQRVRAVCKSWGMQQ